MVIGKGFLREEKINEKRFFAEFNYDDVETLLDNKVYHLINSDEMSQGNFKNAVSLLINKSGEE